MKTTLLSVATTLLLTGEAHGMSIAPPPPPPAQYTVSGLQLYGPTHSGSQRLAAGTLTYGRLNGDYAKTGDWCHGKPGA